MYCPECGNDAGSAKFCPECGANLSGVKDALSGKKAAAPAAAGAPAAGAAEAAPGGPTRLSPAIIWGGFGALAVVVIIVVVMMSGGFGGDSPSDASGTSANNGNASVQAITADTSGSYDELVKRANDLYDQGNTAFQSQQLDQGSAFFSAASKVYAAAWAKKATDPGVGTDYAVTLFYSGDIPAALKQIDAVIKADPDFQKAWLNKGIFVSHEGQLAKQKGQTAEASGFFDEARTALAKAVALDPKSDAGKQADQFMASLPK